MNNKYKLDIVILCHGLPMHGGMLEEGESLGGSETAGIQVAESFARAGHHVTLFCNTEQASKYKDVTYIPIGWQDGPQGGFPKGMFDYLRSNPIDLLICQRQPNFLRFGMESKVNLLWQHDLATKTGPSSFHATLWNISKVLVLSEFMKEQYQKVHGGPDELYHVTRNGIDIDFINGVTDPVERDPFKLMFTARPERGLDIVLQRFFPALLEKEPRAKLYVSRYKDVQNLPMYDQLKSLMNTFGDRIGALGHLGKKDLYTHYKSATAYIYPSAFEEVYGITALETGACGLPFLGPWKGALPETCKDMHPLLVRDNGVLGKAGDPLDKGFVSPSDTFVKEMVSQTLKVMHDQSHFKTLSSNASKKASQMGWDEVTSGWMDLAHEIIGKRTSNPFRLFTHFLEHSDVVSAKRLVEEGTNDPDGRLSNALQNYINTFVPFMNIEETKHRAEFIKQFYEDRSGGAMANWQTAMYAFQEPRLAVMLGFIDEHKDEIKTGLDFGCAHGGYAAAISNTFPNIKVVGVDVSESLIRAANDLKEIGEHNGEKICRYPDNLEFKVANEYSVPSEVIPTGKFDLVIASEVLEHLPNAEEVAKMLEEYCHKDGWMLFTVPYGRHERNEFVNQGVPPVHVRAFDRHDLRDIFGKRKDFNQVTFSPLKELELDESFYGWFMVSYRKDDRKSGVIDWERKKFLQGPRETIALCMIAHNEEAIIQRALVSAQKVVDQIIVVDNGPSTDNTVGVSRKYTNQVRAGTSPFWCYTHKINHGEGQLQPGVCQVAGFETPRNESVEGVWCDWVLWLDADEVLLQTASLRKFLRPNAYPGYAIKQHHLATEPLGPLKTDLPVRIYRSDAGLKFFGKVHEHAEFSINEGIGNLATILAPVHISHDGYLTESIRRGRFARNLQLLQCDRLVYPERILGIYLYDIRDQLHLARYEFEANGGVISAAVVNYCNKIIDTFRREFLHNDIILSWDSLKYYSDALNLLNIGMNFALGLGAGPGQVDASDIITFRAKDAEEASIIMQKRLKGLTVNLEGDYVS